MSAQSATCPLTPLAWPFADALGCTDDDKGCEDAPGAEDDDGTDVAVSGDAEELLPAMWL